MSETLHILHVEDEPDDSELVRAALDADGFNCNVRVVATQQAFLDSLERFRPHLILSDFALPSFDGLSALRIAREKVPDVPFILVSGTIGEEAAIESLRNGATDYVLKHRLSRLPAAARRALDEAQERSRRSAAENALQGERQFLKAVLDSLEAGVVACDSAGILTLMNRAAREIHAKQEAPVAAGAWAERYDLFDAGGKKRLAPEAVPLYRALRGETVRNVEIVIAPPAHPPRTVTNSGQPIVDDAGRTLGAVITIHDITERRLLEAQLRQAQKMEAIGRLAGGVAHDFNNLLNVIMGYGELVLERLGNDHPLRGKLLEIRTAAERAASLTRQLLAFSRKQIVEARVLDLNSLLEETDKMLRRLIGEDIEFQTKKGAELRRFKGDAGHVEQILMNLVVNARDAMPQGGRLTIETANVDLDEEYVRRHAGARAGPYVLLSVADTGAGMTPEVMGRIFEPFFTTKEVGQGTGLGLATVYGIVKQSAGYIWVESEPGRGTTFNVYLPSVDAPADVARRQEPATSPRGQETVLVVEDEDIVREVIGECLRTYGYTVLDTGDVDKAVEISRAHAGEIQLLVTDVVLPKQSGRALARRLTALRTGMKVLFISGYTDDTIAQHGVLEKGIAFLQKPFALTALARKVREVLDAAAGGTA